MRALITFCGAAALALCAGGISGIETAHAANIRVLIASGSAVAVRVPIAPSLAQTGTLAGTGLGPAPVSSYAAWTVSAQGGRLLLDSGNGPSDSGSDTLYLPPAPGSTVDIAGRTYRGGLLLRAVKGQVNAVNVLDLEDYLRGVVGSEMPNTWPTEALRAQAVIARTYAAARINPAGSYDLCATESCQVYGGVSREGPTTDRAVASTNDQVVSYLGRAASTFFSSDSGGYTASSQEAWGLDEPYLQARPDPASQGPNSHWTLRVPLAQVGVVAARYGVRVGAIRSLSVSAVSSSGRASSIVLSGVTGSKTLSGADAGGLLRSLGAHSSRVNFSGSDPLVIDGAGNGHGVGLSQYGAAGLARAGWNYLQIMGFYYSGASISSILEGARPGQQSADQMGAALSAGLPLPLAGEAAPLLARTAVPVSQMPGSPTPAEALLGSLALPAGL